jgi:hypothetical protein
MIVESLNRTMAGDVSLQKSLNVRELKPETCRRIYSVTAGNSKSGGGTGRRTDKRAVGVCQLAVQSARLLAAVRFKIRGKTAAHLVVFPR